MFRAETECSSYQPDDIRTEDMVWIPGGAFRMGSDHHYPEEAPAHRVTVDGFWIDRTPVTNWQFREFVLATGHITAAEIPPSPANDPDAPPDMRQAGSLVFTAPRRVRDLRDTSQWWTFTPGANWRHPYGPETHINVLGSHPVVHITYADALAYAKWVGKELPTEAEWEFAARGGLEDEEYAWGNALMPGGVHMANTWQGNFPVQNLCEDGYDRTSPVTAFPPNGYGVSDMIGNVWEWTTDWWSARHEADAQHGVPHNPVGGRKEASYDPARPRARIPRKVLKGGSHLSAPNYSRRYRPAARHAEAVDASTSHVGFRCVLRSPVSPSRHHS
ncbi:formylglycine-generating enzyme family protein [Bradyrhizobium sp. 31Argb]|uniref:formylglycine-generating enzyme family protein n=1 Tax=Bradyrhizobium sp. 31Argb TaxID=3141247 RepID=UPI003749AA00